MLKILVFLSAKAHNFSVNNQIFDFIRFFVCFTTCLVTFCELMTEHISCLFTGFLLIIMFMFSFFLQSVIFHRDHRSGFSLKHLSLRCRIHCFAQGRVTSSDARSQTALTVVIPSTLGHLAALACLICFGVC